MTCANFKVPRFEALKSAMTSFVSCIKFKSLVVLRYNNSPASVNLKCLPFYNTKECHSFIQIFQMESDSRLCNIHGFSHGIFILKLLKIINCFVFNFASTPKYKFSIHLYILHILFELALTFHLIIINNLFYSNN